MKTLLDLLHMASAIEIDGVLCSNYTLESEECEPEDIALDISYEQDDNIYEHFITFKEVANATQREDGAWCLTASNGDWEEACYIIPYKMTELKLDK